MKNAILLSEKNPKENVDERGALGLKFLSAKISDLKSNFLDYIKFEKGFSTETILKYDDCLRNFVKTVGNIPILDLQVDHVIQMKKKLTHRGVGDARIASIVFALKSFLNYCRDVQKLDCIDSKEIKSPKKQKREVIYLTNEEVEKFKKSIKLYNKWDEKKEKRRINIYGLRFRTLVEVLLGTGMRISEALSLDIDKIEFEKAEATIIGKGDKERSVYFNKQALWWIKKYLETRNDDNTALFITHPECRRLKRSDIWRYFSSALTKAEINKKVSAHTLRHTFATNMLYNGCDLVTIKELLGHHDISITARAYIGIDKRKIKENHFKYLDYKS